MAEAATRAAIAAEETLKKASTPGGASSSTNDGLQAASRISEKLGSQRLTLQHNRSADIFPLDIEMRSLSHGSAWSEWNGHVGTRND